MTWVYFEDSDRQSAVPAFALDRLGGGRVSLEDFYEESILTLLFLPEEPGLAANALARFSARLDEIERQGAQVVALLPDSPQESGAVYDASDLPFPLLADPGGRVRKAYTGQMVSDLVPEGSALLYLLDVYGAPWAAYVGETLDEDGLVDEVLSWLVFIGVQCPE